MIEAKRLLNDFRSRVWMSKREIVLEWIDDNRHHPLQAPFLPHSNDNISGKETCSR